MKKSDQETWPNKCDVSLLIILGTWLEMLK